MKFRDFLPPEAAGASPRVVINGRGEVLVAGHTGLYSYDTGRIRARTEWGILTVEGQQLVISYFGAQDMSIRGRVDQVRLEGEDP